MLGTSYTESITGDQIATSDEMAKYFRSFIKEKGINPASKKDQIIEQMKSITGKNYESEIIQSHDVINYVGKGNVYHELKNRYKPRGPGITTDWFSGRDINIIIDQYNGEFHQDKTGGCHGLTFFDCKCKKYQLEKEKKIFKGLHFNMRDFEKEGGSLQGFNLAKELLQNNCFGSVINTDYSSGMGIHWVSIFIDCSKKPYTFEYFDSGGDPIMPEIITFFKRLISQINTKPGESLIIPVSSRVQQQDNHSCGPYSIYYIRSRLEGVPWKYFRDFEIRDKNMHRFRRQLFRHY